MSIKVDEFSPSFKLDTSIFVDSNVSYKYY